MTTPFIRVGSLSAINRSPDKIGKKNTVHAFGGRPLPQLLFWNQICHDNSNYRTVLKIIVRYLLRGRHVATFLKVVVVEVGGGSKSRQSGCRKKRKIKSKRKKTFVPFFKTPISVNRVRYLNIWCFPIIFKLVDLKISNDREHFVQIFSFNLFFGWSRSPLPHTHTLTPYTHPV